MNIQKLKGKYRVLITILTIIGCAPKTDKVPSSLVPQNTMSDLLTEMHIADIVASQHRTGNFDSIEYTILSYYPAILAKYGVDSALFYQSFDYYRKHPVLLDSVYAEVITKLSSKEMLYRGK